VLALAVFALAAWIGWEAWRWPDVASLARRPPATTAFIERWRAAQRAAGRSDRVERAWVPYAAISPSLKLAVLVAEDINFFSHRGFDSGEIRQALTRAFEGRELPRGASTISQQLAKNLWLSPSRDPLRKTREALLTWQLERTLGKRRILELYLNVVEFGPGTWGAGSASRRYFGKAAADLDDDEAALLAAGLPSPATWHPGATSAAYLRHADTVRRRMDRAQFLRRLIWDVVGLSRGRHGSAGAARALGLRYGAPSRPTCLIEARPGSAGVRRALGGLGAMSGPPSSTSRPPRAPAAGSAPWGCR
jgi:monofunctional biosynthetic peptidoglycan transglycosylase